MLEVIIFGLIRDGNWDLTQPQATLIGGIIGGLLLVVAAVIAFSGQKAQRKEERERHDEQLRAQRKQFDDQVREQRTEWKSTLHAEGMRAERNELIETYAKMSGLISASHSAIIDMYTASKDDQRTEWDALKVRLSLLLVEYQSNVGRVSIVGDIQVAKSLLELLSQTAKWSDGGSFGPSRVSHVEFQAGYAVIATKFLSILAAMRTDVERRQLDTESAT